MIFAEIRRLFQAGIENLSVFSGQKQVISKKKVLAEIGRLFLADIENLSRFSGQKQVIFPLMNQRSNLDGGTPKSRWGDAQSRSRTRPPRPPYNLSTGFRQTVHSRSLRNVKNVNRQNFALIAEINSKLRY